ncbi:MAG TPA: Rieske (2Fe-2S) protein [Alphaproteobacteria bacterium]
MAADATLGAEAYTQGEQFQRERRNLFGRAWLAFCAPGQAREPGAFVSHTIGGWPLFVQRGADGMLRAFHNVCRHQGMPVIEKPTGKCDQLRCRYHGWTYDLTGALVTAPPMVAPADMSAQHLNAISIAEADGLVFVGVKPTTAAPAPLGLDTAALESAATTDVFCNWKTLVEALLPDESWQLAWPNILSRTVNGTRLVRQIVPRSFNRTRIVDLVSAAGPGVEAAVQASVGSLAAADKARAEALQEQRAAGVLDGDGAIADFRGRVIAVCA